jgi:hypothetical protein
MPKIINGNIEFFFRNNSTGLGTAKHIIKPNTDKPFCGWKDISGFAEFQENNNETFVFECCKKCVKAYFKSLNQSL